MRQRYLQLNRIASKALWILVIISLLASLPLMAQRYSSEQTGDTVEFVFDLRDLIVISEYKAYPQLFLDEQLEKLKQAGIHSMAVYESTLKELSQTGSIELFSAEDAATLTNDATYMQQNLSYLLFKDAATMEVIAPIIQDGLAMRDIAVHPWEYNGRQGLAIDLSKAEAELLPLDPDPLLMQYAKDKGFEVVVRLSDRREFDATHMDRLLGNLNKQGVHWIVFGGNSVTGFADQAQKRSLQQMAELMKKHEIGFTAIELLKTPQKGVNQLAYYTDYNVVRLHSLLEGEARTFSEDRIKDRLVLAAKDRNIRMIFLNVDMQLDSDAGILTTPLNKLIRSLQGEDGAVQRIKDAGFQLGTAQPFEAGQQSWEKPLKAIVLIGMVALIALTLSRFIPSILSILFILGLIGVGGLYVLSSTFAVQLAALATGICAPVLAIMVTTDAAKRRGTAATGLSAAGGALKYLVQAVIITLIGIILMVGMLNNITYMLLLEQFRGVSLLYSAPIALAALYILFFGEGVSFRESLGKIRKLLFTNIYVLWVILAGVAGVALLYYMSRTGNEGSVSGIEQAFRAFLENTLGVRPRNKEIFVYPLFLLGLYLTLRYKGRNKEDQANLMLPVQFMLIFGVVALVSALGSFAHFHTPLLISAIRGVLGLTIGAIGGLIMIGIWQIAVKGWTKWAPMFKE